MDFSVLYAKIMEITKETNFLIKFDNLLSDKFNLTSFDFSERLNIKIELSCIKCGKITHRKYYNLFKSSNCLSCFAKEKADERSNVKLLTKEDFIKLLPENFNYEVLTEIINTNKKVTIKDEFGICEVIGRNLIKGIKPCLINASDKTSYRLASFNKVHSNKYTYPDYKFSKNDAKINFICEKHGLQDIIETNHMKGWGCKDCNTKGAPKMDNEIFLQRVKENNPDIEMLEDRGNYHVGILCKNKYGLVKISPDHLLKGVKGSLRTAVDKTSYMIEQFKEKHNNKYTYPNYEYCGNRCLGKIECSIHGEFEQLTDVHLMGSGCTACSYLDSNRIKGHSRGDFIEASKGRECILYIIEMSNSDEIFYKIGITSHTVTKRFKKANDVKYNYISKYEYKNYDAGYIWDLEKKLHREYRYYHYLPKIYFKGITECFTTELPIEEIINHLHN